MLIILFPHNMKIKKHSPQGNCNKTDNLLSSVQPLADNGIW